MSNQPESKHGGAYHRPVMLHECLEALRIRPDGTYADVTFGGGGHSMAILGHLTSGRLIALDQDEDAAEQAARIQSRSFTFCKANFRDLSRVLNGLGIRQVDGILADLGISSHQIDAAERGFSTRFDGPLDMRMDRSSGRSAADVVSQYTETDLHRILGMYGEIRNARTTAARIVSSRHLPMRNTYELKKILHDLAPRGKEHKWFAQVFQALRIEVNQEMQALEDFLRQTAELIRPGGRLVIMSYHSLEDRMVKNFLATGKTFGELDKDFFGNPIRPFDPVFRKVVVASDQEVADNSRARSARLRVGERRSMAEQ